MPWLKSDDDAPVVISIDARWPDRQEIWDLSDREYRAASLAKHQLLAEQARERRSCARQKQAISNRHHGARRRAAERGASGAHTAIEWAELVRASGGRCAYCGASDRLLTRDHVVAISRGGSDDIGNIVPACRPCNSRKGAR